MLPPIPNLVSSHRGHDDLYGSLDFRRATPNGRQFAFSTIFLVTAAGFPVAGGTLQRSVSSPTTVAVAVRNSFATHLPRKVLI